MCTPSNGVRGDQCLVVRDATNRPIRDAGANLDPMGIANHSSFFKDFVLDFAALSR